jgi:hypothetical protein
MKLINHIEQLGNRLPDPATLFVIATVVVMGLSQLAVVLGWSVSNPATGTIHAQSLLSADGIWWLLSHMVENFIRFPPLAIVLVGMLGIGLAELSGLLPVLLRYLIVRVPASLLTPATVFLGIMCGGLIPGRRAITAGWYCRRLRRCICRFQRQSPDYRSRPPPRRAYTGRGSDPRSGLSGRGDSQLVVHDHLDCTVDINSLGSHGLVCRTAVKQNWRRQRQ